MFSLLKQFLFLNNTTIPSNDDKKNATSMKEDATASSNDDSKERKSVWITREFNHVHHLYKPMLTIINHEYNPEVSGELPIKVNIGKDFPPIRNQGKRSTCVAYSLVAVLEYMIKEHYNTNIKLSEKFLYMVTKWGDGSVTQDDGIYVEQGLKTLIKYGVCEEEYCNWKECSYLYSRETLPDDQSFTEAKNYKISSNSRLIIQTHVNKLNHLKKFLSMKVPLIVVLAGWDKISNMLSMFSGVVPTKGWRKDVLWRHAVVLVGYNDKKKRFKFRNSWGTKLYQWGDKGYGYIDYDNISIVKSIYYIRGLVNRLDSIYNGQYVEDAKGVEEQCEGIQVFNKQLQQYQSSELNIESLF